MTPIAVFSFPIWSGFTISCGVTVGEQESFSPMVLLLELLLFPHAASIVDMAIQSG